MRDRKMDAIESAWIAFAFVVGALLVIGIVVACIIGPLTGHWEPDLAVAFWAVVSAIFYGVYRFYLWWQA